MTRRKFSLTVSTHCYRKNTIKHYSKVNATSKYRKKKKTNNTDQYIYMGIHICIMA